MQTKLQKHQARKIEFKYLWLSIEHYIGNAHLPLFADADNLAEFIADIDSQSNPLHQVIKECYDLAKCESLRSPINPFIVMDRLGECLYQQKSLFDADVTLIDMIERIGLHINQRFLPKNSATDTHQRERITTQVIFLNR